ncbi:type II and III secretion system protein [Pedobacter sp. ASV12]|uniref:type II and III secretion system protein n=1 Tax=Pedobacter sp. ASV12 TaxID=2795120 RepID=UPI001E3C0F39|nr:type II and III secretion system protein [Pedobacter sp. ASV12]
MIVLGGLERTENSESGSGVPLLSRIPILKWLFSSREKSNAKVVTLVFIKPTILY